MDRFACPPWFECRCIPGKPVSLSTMLAHRRYANTRRRQIGRGAFKRGPKLDRGDNCFFFHSTDTLEAHPSDDEADAQDQRPNQITAISRSSSPQNASLSWNVPPEVSINAAGEQGVEQVNSHSRAESTNSDPVNALMNAWSNIEAPQALINSEIPPQPLSSPLQTADSALVNSQCDESNPAGHEGYAGESILSPGAASLYGTSEDEHLPAPSVTPQVQHYTEVQMENAHDDDEHGSEDVLYGPPDSGGALATLQILTQTALGALQDDDPEGAFEARTRIDGLLDWVKDLRGWVDLFLKRVLEVELMDDMLPLLNSPCRRWRTIMANITEAAGITECIQVQAVCPGHMTFAEPTDGVEIEWSSESCSECGSSAPSTLAEAEGLYSTIPLIPRIAAIVRDEGLCKKFYDYRWRRGEGENGMLRDYFDGEGYRKLCDMYGGEEEVKYDVFLGISADGFEPYKNRRYSVWSIAAINLNLPPHERFKVKNILPLGFVPGPTQPKNLQSYCVPIINEVRKTLSSDGVKLRFYDGAMRMVRIHIVAFSGDQPATCKLSGLVGHNGKTPCRACKIQGLRVGHYYFPSKVKSESLPDTFIHMFDIRNLPPRLESESLSTITELQYLRGGQLRTVRRETGIREGSLFLSLPNFNAYASFPQDTMHTFNNVQVELLRILLDEDYEDSFTISKSALAVLDQELLDWGMGLPAEMGRKPRFLSKYGDWKASKLKVFSISYALVLFDGYLPQTYMDGLAMFAEIVDICCKPEVAPRDISRLRSLAIRFVEHYERDYVRYEMDRAHMCKSTIHALLHLADCMK